MFGGNCIPPKTLNRIQIQLWYLSSNLWLYMYWVYITFIQKLCVSLLSLADRKLANLQNHEISIIYLNTDCNVLHCLYNETVCWQIPAVAEFSTGEVMGHSADRLCAAFGISRIEQVNYRNHSTEQWAERDYLISTRNLVEQKKATELFYIWFTLYFKLFVQIYIL